MKFTDKLRSSLGMPPEITKTESKKISEDIKKSVFNLEDMFRAGNEKLKEIVEDAKDEKKSNPDSIYDRFVLNLKSGGFSPAFREELKRVSGVKKK